jgi:hypothetical protein
MIIQLKPVTSVPTPHMLLHTNNNSRSRLFTFHSQCGVLTFRGTEVKCTKVKFYP